jgi:hypothetical protein
VQDQKFPHLRNPSWILPFSVILIRSSWNTVFACWMICLCFACCFCAGFADSGVGSGVGAGISHEVNQSEQVCKAVLELLSHGSFRVLIGLILPCSILQKSSQD